MPFIHTLSTVNSFLRTLIGLFVLGVVTVAGWLGYSRLSTGGRLAQVEEELATVSERLRERAAQVDRLNADLEASHRKIDQLQTALHLLKVDHRLADITVLEQGVDAATNRKYSEIEFVEVNDQGQPIDSPKRLRLWGDKIYVDYWVVKFEDQYVEKADLDRSTSICLFRKIYGEFQNPADGYVLDAVGSRPTAYAQGGRMSDFEQRIWNDFWDLANDPARAKENGIRAIHGEAVYTELRPGMTYRLELRASGGLSIAPVDRPPPRSQPAA
jgi:hypothetical protein